MIDELLNYFNGDELAASTWKKKYAAKDEETPNDMHKRLAKEFSKIEEKYKDVPVDKEKLSDYGKEREYLSEEKIFELFKNFKYVIPGGSVMSGAGTGQLVSLSNCFVAGTKVLTKRGLINIEDIKEGDLVLSDDNEYHRVNATMKREYKGDLYKFSGKELYDDIICTPNHKFLTNHGWKRADRILACSDQISSVDEFKKATENNEYVSISNIEILEDQETTVYNISVEETHTYNVNGIICHNCFVIGSPEDSYADIMETRSQQVQLMKRRGGVGYDLSKLRPRGASVNNAAKTSTGAASFMDVCSDITNEVAQNGRR